MSAVRHLEERLAASQAHVGYVADQLRQIIQGRSEPTKDDLQRILELAGTPTEVALRLHAADVLEREAWRHPDRRTEMVSRASVRERLKRAAAVERAQAQSAQARAYGEEPQR